LHTCVFTCARFYVFLSCLLFMFYYVFSLYDCYVVCVVLYAVVTRVCVFSLVFVYNLK